MKLIPAINASLTLNTMLSMGLRISVIITIAAIISYLHIVDNLEQKTLDELEQYINERVARESEIFQLAEDNHRVFAQRYLALWQQRQQLDPRPRFDTLFEPFEQGTYRLKASVFEGELGAEKQQQGSYQVSSRWISGFVGKNTPVDDTNFLNRLIISYDLVRHFSEGWSNRFANTYVSLPEGTNVVYWPELNWAAGASPDLDIPKEEWVYIANVDNNPERKSVWTGLYYDQTADAWMVSCETPIDDRFGQHLANVGHDILLDNLFERVFQDHLTGAYNYIVRLDGRLIAHPDYVDALASKLGLLNINEAGDDSLKQQFAQIQLAMQSSPEQKTYITEARLPSGQEAFLAFSEIKGPSWQFVTVYPKKLLSSTAKKSAEFIFSLGLISLILEVIMLYFVLNKKVISPLQQLKYATEALGEKDATFSLIVNKLDTKNRQDEIGDLSKTFVEMAGKIKHYQLHLEDAVEERTKELEWARRKAEEQARTDSLTGLANRLAFFEFAELALAQVRRQKQTLSVIMIDIDYFKKINDEYGHAGGDLALQFFAKTLNNLLRKADLPARMGGEEFAVLLPNCDLQAAVKIAEKIHHQFATTQVPGFQPSFTMTASFGVAELTQQHRSIDELLCHADQALYEAKRNGRNGIASY